MTRHLTAGRISPAGGVAAALWRPAALYAVLTVAGAAFVLATVHPGLSLRAELRAQGENPLPGEVSAVLVLASGAPLVVWSARARRRLRVRPSSGSGRLVVWAAWSAAVALGVSGLLSMVAVATAPREDVATAATLVLWAFFLGGPGFMLLFSLLVGCVAGRIPASGPAPRRLRATGFLVAVLGCVSALSFVTEALSWLLPVVRYGGAAWMVAVGVALPARAL